MANKGYDQEAFSNYLKSLKPSSKPINIDNWSLPELERAVKKFVRFDKKQIEYYKKKSLELSTEEKIKRDKERKARKAKFNIDPINTSNKKSNDKNPFRKKPLPSVSNPCSPQPPPDSAREEKKER